VAYYSLKAEFFATADGLVIPKAPPLKRSVAFNVWSASSRYCSLCGTEVDWFAANTTSPFRKGASKAHIDHIIPRSRGGQNNTENLRVTCMSCNCSRKADI
jgi:5-methylcytosine-specific restriction endonuclease McrA